MKNKKYVGQKTRSGQVSHAMEDSYSEIIAQPP